MATQFLDNAFVTCAQLACTKGRLSHAARLLATVEKVEEDWGRVLPPHHRKRFEEVRALIDSRLGPEEIAAAAADARNDMLRDAVQYALASLD